MNEFIKQQFIEENDLILNEATRSELLNKSKFADREKKSGKTRYEMKDSVRVFNTTRNFDRIDFNALFKVDLLSVKLPIQGTTNNYEVEVFFDGFCEDLQREIKNNNWICEYKCVYRAIIDAINRTDIFVACTCPDFKFTHAFQASKGRYNAGQPQITPAPIRNPNDSKGAGCKHIMNVIANLDWALKLATCVNNYITYIKNSMEEKYQEIIFPAIYGMSYEQAINKGIISLEPEENDTDELEIVDSEGTNEPVEEPEGSDEEEVEV